MNVEELNESTEHAHHSGQRGIGLTTAIVAVLLAVATLLSHRAHTEEIKLQTKVNDGWAFYQAKHNRAHEYGKYAENEALANQKDVAMKDLKISILEECGAPAEENCTSPVVKESVALKQLIKDTVATAGGHTLPPESAPNLASVAAREAGASGKEKPLKGSVPRKEGAVAIQEKTLELEKETELISNKAGYYDSAELFLEISIVLCSIALLAETKLYWRLSFVSTALGIGVAVWGRFLR
ncbi:MAG TPA: DUF4337 family protein [Candidatus Angelobacter sp.]